VRSPTRKRGGNRRGLKKGGGDGGGGTGGKVNLGGHRPLKRSKSGTGWGKRGRRGPRGKSGGKYTQAVSSAALLVQGREIWEGKKGLEREKGNGPGVNTEPVRLGG